MSFRIATSTLGCKTNQYDTAALLGRLDSQVFTIVPFTETADIYLINSCTVTTLAERQSRQFAYQARRRNPEALVILTGCYATTAREQLASKPEIDFVIPGGDSEILIKLILEAARRFDHDPLPVDHGPIFSSRTRPYLKIQDGCEASCSYCIIPKARGEVKSSPIDDVLRRLQVMEATGYHELVLTGIHVGQWGRDLEGKPSFYDLLLAIEQSRPQVRVRISSLEPMELSDPIIDLVANSKVFCRHLHIPLQSGSDEILKRMRRPYLTRQYRERVVRAVAAMKGLALGVDVIVGFPTEGEEQFEETFSFVQSLPFQYLHVFPYSERPGTPAAEMEGQVPVPERKRRAGRLIELGRERRRRSAEDFLGKQLSVLVEENRESKNGMWKGISDNYHEVLIDSDDDLKNRTIKVRAERLFDQSHRLLATLADDTENR